MELVVKVMKSSLNFKIIQKFLAGSYVNKFGGVKVSGNSFEESVLTFHIQIFLFKILSEFLLQIKLKAKYFFRKV